MKNSLKLDIEKRVKNNMFYNSLQMKKITQVSWLENIMSKIDTIYAV